MSEIGEKVLAGDVRSVARLISDIDDENPKARDTLRELYPHTGKAYVIGITGAPGVGKSTLVDRLLSHLRKKRKTVGILAIDPTSPFSGGAILGDRIRMQKHSLDEGVFIRSMATRGHFGGLTHSTRSAIDVLDAMGKDYIIVETVGVGQDEVEIVKSAHTTVVVVVPGMGDDVQAIKAGILEVGDIFVVNKSEREGVDKTLGELQSMIEMGQIKHEQGSWKAPVIKTEATINKGVGSLLTGIQNHRTYLLEQFGEINLRHRKNSVREELKGIVKSRLIQEMFGQLTKSGEFEKAVNRIVEGKLDPYSASEDLIINKFGIKISDL